MAPRRQVNSATLLMGVTGSGKSSQLAALAKWLWRTHKKVLRVASSDGGGYPAVVEECIQLGIIQMFRMLTRDPGDLGLAFETCQRVCQGWWPAKIRPATGEVEPGVPLVPPITIRYEVLCPAGHIAASLPNASIATQPRKCPTCGVTVTSQNTKGVHMTMKPTPGFENVGGMAFDGLSSMLAWEMRELGHRAGRMELKGEEAAIGGKVVSGDLKFGGTTRSHVGFVQARGEELVHLTLGIPNLVIPPIFTALTHEDVDDRSLSIRGPKIAGRAKTDEAPQWFGNCLEAAVVPNLSGGAGSQRVIYLDEFTDTASVRHLVKNRAAPGTMPAMLVDPVEDKAHPELAFTGCNLGVFFEMLDQALTAQLAAGKEEFSDTPGLPAEDEVSFGVPIVAGATVQTANGTTAAVPAAPAAGGAAVTRPSVRPRTTTKRTTAPAAPQAAAPEVAAPDAPAQPAADTVGVDPAGVVEGAATLPVPAAPEEPAAVVEQPPAVEAPVALPVAASAPLPPAGAPRPAPQVAAPRSAPAAARPMMAPPPGVRPAGAVARPPAGAPRIPAPRPTPGAPPKES